MLDFHLYCLMKLLNGAKGQNKFSEHCFKINDAKKTIKNYIIVKSSELFCCLNDFAVIKIQFNILS